MTIKATHVFYKERMNSGITYYDVMVIRADMAKGVYIATDGQGNKIGQPTDMNAPWRDNSIIIRPSKMPSAKGTQKFNELCRKITDYTQMSVKDANEKFNLSIECITKEDIESLKSKGVPTDKFEYLNSDTLFFNFWES